MKILLIMMFDHISFSYHNYETTLGLLSLATILKENGYDVEIVDFNYLFLNKVLHFSKNPLENLENMTGYILEKKPDVVGFNTMCNSFHNIFYITGRIREHNREIIIVLGGPQVSTMPREVLETYEWIDIVCPGESENKILQLIRGLENKRLHDVPGIFFRDGEAIVRTPEPEMICDMDSLPIPDYKLIPYFPGLRITIEVNRGCPFNCIYCATSGYWKRKFRKKSIERVIREIAAIKKHLGDREIKAISFVDDNFTTDHDYVIMLCERLKEMNVKWDCSARIDTLDENLVKKMAEAGCIGIFMGLESGSPKIQKYIHKNIRLDKVYEVIDILLKYKISPVASFIYGFPGETEDDVNMTLRMAYTLMKKGIHRSDMHSLCVLSGTRLYEEQKGNLALREFGSNLTDNFSFEACKSLFEKNPALFPHVFVIENSFGDKYMMLEKFSNFFINGLYRVFAQTIDNLIELFAGNILEFYKDFMNIAGDRFKEFFKKDIVEIITERDNLSRPIVSFLAEYINSRSRTDFRFKMVTHVFCMEKKKAAKQENAAAS